MTAEPLGPATFVDSNVLLDLVTDAHEWSGWSQIELERASVRGALLIDSAVYAEVSMGFPSLEDLDAALTDVRLEIVPTPRPALFLAGKIFLSYRRAGGTRTGVLPDFFIGAHAAVAGLPLLTRDARRYRTYFPSVRLITLGDA